MGVLKIAIENFNKVIKKSASESHINPVNWLDKAVPQDCWDDHTEASILKEWASEISRAAESQDRPWWELAGTNIVVAQEDQSDLREVVRLLADAMKVQAAFIPASEIKQILPDIRSSLAPIAPALVMLEGGNWCDDVLAEDDPFSRDDDNGPEEAHNQKTALCVMTESLKHFDPQKPIFLLLGVSVISSISDALCQRGAFDRFIVVGNKPRDKLGKQFCDAIGHVHVGATLSSSLGKLGMLIQNEFQTKERRELAALQLTRLAHKLN
jgi:hypothetical protein